MITGTVVGLVILVLWLVLVPRRLRISTHRAIAARADAEHTALLDGDIETGVYGRFPPAV